jgi:L-threonylcarbamoyladenylate synthase
VGHATTFDLTTPLPGSGLLTLGDADRIAATLRAGGLAVLPTETGHLLASSIGAARKVFAVKQRSLTNPMHVACSSLAMAGAYGRLGPGARRLLGTLTPGPLSVVVAQVDGLDNPYVTLNGTIGLRVPDHPATLQVIAALGEPVTATSFNRSGEESRPVDLAALEAMDWHAEPVVHAVMDPHAVRYAQASTLVRLTGPRPEILRPGPVSAETIDDVLSRDDTGVHAGTRCDG